MIRPAALLTLIALCMFGSSAHASVPPMMNYQGYLTDAANTPRQGSFPMSFALFAGAAGGAPLWSEMHGSVAVGAGVFNVLLGSVNPLPSAVFGGGLLWLETTISDTTLTPRRPLVSVPYSFRAHVADSVPPVPRVQAFLTTGPNQFAAPPGVTMVYITMVGGGGGGGGVFAGNGGGGGATVINFPYPVTPGQTYNITVGAGGVTGTSGAGGTGGSSSFGTLVCAGGTGGVGTVAGKGAGGFDGKSASGTAPGFFSEMSLQGGDGGTRTSSTSAGGGGGGTIFGRGGSGGGIGEPGTGALPNTGAGAGGSGNGGGLPGDGGSGFVIVFY